jgi:hypothetical protein
MKTLILLLALPFVYIQSFGQNCATLVYPSNNQQLVPLFYDNVEAVPNGKSNGVELKWRKTGVPMYVMIKFAGDCCYSLIAGNAFSNSGPIFTSDTSVIVPFAYNTSYQWFVTSENITTACSPASVFAFKTVPPPPNCKPGCMNVYEWNFYAFKYQIPGRNNYTAVNEGFACHLYTPAGAVLSELVAGKSYAVSLWQEFSTSFTIWIDFNDNGYFEDTERLLYQLIPYLSQNYWQAPPAITLIQIPGSAPPGNHRIRIKTGNGDDPCSNVISMGDGFVKIVASDNTFYSLAQASTVNTCETVVATTISPKANNNSDWVPLVDVAGNILASIKANGNDLGTTTVKLYSNSGPVRTLPNNKKVLDRSLEIKVEKQPVTPVDVRIYFSQAEFNALKAADNSITDISSLNISKFSSGCGDALSGYNFIGQSTSGSINGYHYIQFATSSFSEFYLRGGVDPGLPVHFLSASAKRAGKDIMVNWKTATEQNNKGFEIEYSVDGLQFRSLSFVASKATAGNSNAALDYDFLHTGAPIQVGYYRIKQIDKDGTERFSNVLNVAAISGEKLSITKVFPNPSKDKVWLLINAPNTEAVKLEISNMAGVVLLQQKMELLTGENKTEISLDALASGIYLINIKDADGRKLAQSRVSKW